MVRIIIIVFFLFNGTISGYSQQVPTEDDSYKPLIIKLNENGTKYARIITWHQFWITANQNNPGTKDANGNLIDGTEGSDAWSTDIALRRSRFLVVAQVSPRFLILSHWGLNNQSFMHGGTPPSGSNSTITPNNQGKKPSVFLHDAWTEYRIIPHHLYLGVGLLYWNGISRLTSHSTLSFMTLDAPIFNWPNIEATDQFARQFGIYAKGQLGKLDYRISLNKPFVNGASPVNIPKSGEAMNVFTENYATAGYINWMLWEKESNVLPYFTGSYLGSKKVFNIGVGWYHQPKASLYKTSTDSTYHDHFCLGADLFLDMPVTKVKGSALSILATVYFLDYGPNYIRNIGILNEHASPTPTMVSYSGGGNAQPTIGTGLICYMQAGFLLPKLKDGSAFMPYLTTTYKDFNKLSSPVFQYGLGLNYFINGHHAKITLEYARRPVYKQENDIISRDGGRGQFTLQTQVFL